MGLLRQRQIHLNRTPEPLIAYSSEKSHSNLYISLLCSRQSREDTFMSEAKLPEIFNYAFNAGNSDVSLTKPRLPLNAHGNIYPILANEDTDRSVRIQSLAKLTLSFYLESLVATTTAPTNDDNLNECIDFALYLRQRASNDKEVMIDLEMLDEAVEPMRNISPIVFAQDIERLEGRHPLTGLNTLIMKLWTFERYGNPDEMPTHFDNARETSKTRLTILPKPTLIRRSPF